MKNLHRCCVRCGGPEVAVYFRGWYDEIDSAMCNWCYFPVLVVKKKGRVIAL